MQIVVVGGGGFIGSALLKHLAERHHCLGFGPGSRYAELREKIPGEVEFIEGALISREDMEKTATALKRVMVRCRV